MSYLKAGIVPYLSGIFLQVEDVELVLVLVVLHGLSFTLPGGLFTPLERKRRNDMRKEKKEKRDIIRKRKDEDRR